MYFNTVKKLILLLLTPFIFYCQNEIDYSSESSIIKYINSRSSNDHFEGLWKSKYGNILIQKGVNEIYYAIYADYKVIPPFPQIRLDETRIREIWKPKDTIATFEFSKDKSLVFIKSFFHSNYMSRKSAKEHMKLNPNSIIIEKNVLGTLFITPEEWTIKTSEINTKSLERSYVKDFLVMNGKGVLKFELIKGGEPFSNYFYKFYPSSNDLITESQDENKWLGNGSGIVISSSGYIITNNHVIEGVNDIEVELNSDGQIREFSAEVVQKDIRNDLAILKIVDINFDGLKNINYNFKTSSSDVGTKIYTFGYPKALSGMGKEMKVTEGIISSKSGVMGDVTTYQITAPIQGGNSGGPLFDENGNLIGINSSKFNSEETENVNYSIKSSYVMNLIDILPITIDLPSSTKLQSLPLTEQIKEISKYVVLIKVK